MILIILFAGKVLHSHLYRFPEPFSGQTVVVLGAKASGIDISIELAKAGAKVTTNLRTVLNDKNLKTRAVIGNKVPMDSSSTVCVQVILSHRDPPLMFPLHPGIQQTSSLVAVNDNGSIRLQVNSTCTPTMETPV